MNKKILRQLGTILLVLLVPIVPFAVIGELPGARWLSAVDESAWLFALTGGTLLGLDILLPLPSSIIGTLLGARLGLLPGFAATWLGLTAGHALGYLLGRLALNRVGGDLPQVPTLVAVFLSRPVPVLAEAMSFAAGATAMPATRFLAVCGAGNVVYAAVLAGNGAALLPDALFGVGLVIPMLLPVAGWGIWRLLERRRQTPIPRDPDAA